MSDRRELLSNLLTGVNAAYVETLYDEFRTNPSSVEGAWGDFFASLSEGERQTLEEAIARRREAANAEEAPAAPSGPDGSPAVELLAPSRPVNGKAGVPPQSLPATTSAPATEGRLEPLTGISGKIVANMEASLEIPVATTVRTVPTKALEENRRILNLVLERRGRPKLTFTHLIGYALVRALVKHPAMNVAFEAVSGVPHRRVPSAVNFGLAVDLPRADGGRSLVVPNVKNATALSFAEFTAACDDVIARARAGKLTAADFQGTTITLTNPGTLGTVASVPRLVKGQGAILATGAIEYPSETEAMSDEAKAAFGISKVLTITSTYDHRVIQGAESGAFLAHVHELLTGRHDFYDAIFDALRVRRRPFTMARDRKLPIVAIDATKNALERSAKAAQLVHAFRNYGHLLSDLDPLGLARKPRQHPELELEHYGFTIWDLDREFYAAGIGGKHTATLREILDLLQDFYGGTVGIEITHLLDSHQRAWLLERVESAAEAALPGADETWQVLRKLIEAEDFERFLHTRYVGKKRFSLEGGEALIPLLDLVFRRAAESGVEEIVVGMAHRGRLNVLANLAGMPLEKIFAEFEDQHEGEDPAGASGDVKYHLGFTGTYVADLDRRPDRPTDAPRQVTVTVAANPSHLEAVDPVVEGMVRAKQDRSHDNDRRRILPVLIHGDAAMAGQGVVAETLGMSQLEGYRTGGTIHIVVNNQIGFTTDPKDARSSLYCSDIAKMIDAPVFHVNGDDPLAVLRVAKLAFEYQRAFAHDVVIDLVCYRRHGHNEGDEPGFTQPRMVRAIERHPSVRETFEAECIRRKVVTEERARAYDSQYLERLTAARDRVRARAWRPAPVSETVPAVPRAEAGPEILRRLGHALCELPDGFTPHVKIERMLRRWRKMIDGDGLDVDFGLAESLAYATLLAAGIPVRLTGEDSGRGTFSHRHSVLRDWETGLAHVPLNGLAGKGRPLPGQAKFEVVDSLLSEAAALGFEYGYSVCRPEAFVLWEAQFGDFVNGAQVQIDQFLVSGEVKWAQRCGLTLLLPHGFDGQGPEHSSARLERFLQLCAKGNLRIANATTAAQWFHLLREQALSEVRKPLVVLSPKSLLRAAEAMSPFSDLTSGGFRPLLVDRDAPAAGARRVLLCSGKVAYDLEAERRHRGLADVAVVRLERLYPFPAAELESLLAQHADSSVFWVQEEPENMGAARFALPRLRALVGPARPLSLVSRAASPSPATGSARAHAEEQRAIVSEAFAGL